ncbi:transcriptional regulator [Salmonella enterica]|nr:transcriptional regulator [Salmonella enterica]
MKQFDLLALHESSNKISMTSRDIADLVGSRHSDVKRSIERLSERDVIQKPPMAFLERINGLGLTVRDEVYNFEGEDGKRDSIVVVAQLNPSLTAQLVDRWRELESGKALPHSYQQQSAINPDFMALTRTVTEATASAMMKTVLENTGIQAIVHVNATVSAPPATEPAITTRQDDRMPVDDAEFVPVHKVSLATSMSDASCRKLIGFADLPTRKFKGSYGLLVHRESFMLALRTLIDESTPPVGKHKRWQHPDFGGFSLKKDPQEIFGEAA